MNKIFLLISFLFSSLVYSQNTKRQNRNYNKVISKSYTAEYLNFKEKIQAEFLNTPAGAFGMFVKGTAEDIKSNDKVLAFTFDACIGKSKDYNQALIDYFIAEKIPATLFVTGLWIDSNLEVFKELANNPLFELENHGLLHRLCSVNGETKYGIAATNNVGEVIDEMELNARKMNLLTGKRPQYFRSATTYTNEECAKIANALNMKIVSYDILSGDAVPFTPAKIIAENIIKQAHSGAIVIMHFNHPSWYEKEALQLAIPILRAENYKFVKLETHQLINNQH